MAAPLVFLLVEAAAGAGDAFRAGDALRAEAGARAGALPLPVPLFREDCVVGVSADAAAISPPAIVWIGRVQQ